MYQSAIGMQLINAVNAHEGKSRTARQFFDEVYAPLFFGSPRFLQFVNNCPFDQKVTKQKQPLTPELYEECLNALHQNVQTKPPDASFYIGGAASGATETTSGQVTGMRIPIPQDEVYASWIGAAAGAMVAGGWTIAIPETEVLLEIYRGWAEYRRWLDQTSSAKPCQVNTWNGQWLRHRLGQYRNDPIALETSADGEGLKLETLDWVQLMFALAYNFRERPKTVIPAYIYNLGQSNTTVGFIQLNLPQVRRPFQLFQQLYSVPEGLPANAFERLYNTERGLEAACRFGEIGLRAIQPKDVFKSKSDIPKLPDATSPERRLAFDTYQTWIIAMLNNTNLQNTAKELATALHQFEATGQRGTSAYRAMVGELLKAKNRREFIEKLTEVLEKQPETCSLFETTVAELLNMTVDNTTLFFTLVRFQYAVVAAKGDKN